MLQTNEQVIEMMEKCRQVCSIGHSLRKSKNLSVKLPLKELQFEGIILFKQYRDLIKDELNVVDVNHFIKKGEFKHLITWKRKLFAFFSKKWKKKNYELLGEEWIEMEKDGIKVALNIHLDHWQLKAEIDAKERRQEIMNKK